MDSIDTKGTAGLVKGNVVYLVDGVEDNSLGRTTRLKGVVKGKLLRRR